MSAPKPQLSATPAPYYVRAIAMAVPAIMLGLQISGWIFFIASIRDGHPDFRANYTAGWMVGRGQTRHIYDYDAIKAVQDSLISHEVVGMPFIHPAYEALAYVPFGLLPFHAAYCAFLIGNSLLLLFCYRLLRTEMEPLHMAWRPLAIALCFTFLPVGAALMQGQDSILLLALFTAGWALMTSNKDLPGGALLGLGIFRFQFVLPILLLFVLWRRWRVSAGIACSAALSLLISLGMVGLDGAKSYVRSLASMSIGGVSQVEQIRYAQPVAAMGSLRALIAAVLSSRISGLWIQIVIVVLSLAVLLWAWRAAAARSRSSDLLLIAITASAIVGYHEFIHDMAILLLPIAVCLGRTIRFAATGDSLQRRLLWCSALLFAGPMIIVSPIHLYWITIVMLAFLWAQVRVHHSEKIESADDLPAPAAI